jgi:hypothetical protein
MRVKEVKQAMGPCLDDMRAQHASRMLLRCSHRCADHSGSVTLNQPRFAGSKTHPMQSLQRVEKRMQGRTRGQLGASLLFNALLKLLQHTDARQLLRAARSIVVGD